MQIRKLVRVGLFVWPFLLYATEPTKESFEETEYRRQVTLTQGGCLGAQERVSAALSEGTLGQDIRSEERKYEELVAFAERGWKGAQEYVARAHEFNMLGGI